MPIGLVKKFIDDSENDPNQSMLLAKHEALKHKIERIKSYPSKALKPYLEELEEDYKHVNSIIDKSKTKTVNNDNDNNNNDNNNNDNMISFFKPVKKSDEQNLNDIPIAKVIPDRKKDILANEDNEDNEDNGDNEDNEDRKNDKFFKKLMEQQKKVIEENKKAKSTHVFDQFTGNFKDTEEITLSGSKYFIRYDKESRERRREIFLNNDDKLTLTDAEKELLDNIGITDDTYNAVRMYLFDFFEALPNCQSSIAILTNRQCEVSYYILWSVLLKARQDVQRKIDEQTSQGLIDSKLLQYEARLKSMTTRGLITNNAKKPCDANHGEHMEITNMIKRLEGKLDSVKTKVDTLKSQKSQKGGSSGGGLNEMKRLYMLEESTV
jgi:hypothetical protein